MWTVINKQLSLFTLIYPGYLDTLRNLYTFKGVSCQNCSLPSQERSNLRFSELKVCVTMPLWNRLYYERKVCSQMGKFFHLRVDPFSEWNMCSLTLLLLIMTCPVLANSVDPDQLASEEANWSGSALFVNKYVNFYKKPGSSNLTGWKLEVGVASLFIQHEKG